MKQPSARAASFIACFDQPMTYWLQIGSLKFPILLKVANINFNVPASQAAFERVWSIYDFLLTKRRNRLNPDKVTKLVKQYMNADIADVDYNFINGMMGFDSSSIISDHEDQDV